MQFIVNCFVPWQGGFVMLQKPRRGWWYLPGGKVEDLELWRDAAIREFREETGLSLQDADLVGVYRVHMAGAEGIGPKERLIAQFIGRDPIGTLYEENREGKLAVMKPEDLLRLPMDEGDRLMVKHTVSIHHRRDSKVIFGRFEYDANHQVQTFEMDPDNYPLEPLPMDLNGGQSP